MSEDLDDHLACKMEAVIAAVFRTPVDNGFENVAQCGTYHEQFRLTHYISDLLKVCSGHLYTLDDLPQLFPDLPQYIVESLRRKSRQYQTTDLSAIIKAFLAHCRGTSRLKTYGKKPERTDKSYNPTQRRTAESHMQEYALPADALRFPTLPQYYNRGRSASAPIDRYYLYDIHPEIGPRYVGKETTHPCSASGGSIVQYDTDESRTGSHETIWTKVYPHTGEENNSSIGEMLYGSRWDRECEDFYHVASEDSPFQLFCRWSSCNQCFNTKNELHDHVFEHFLDLLRRSSVKTKTFKCKWVGCTAPDRKTTKHLDHACQHTLNPAFACEDCGAKFISDGWPSRTRQYLSGEWSLLSTKERRIMVRHADAVHSCWSLGSKFVAEASVFLGLS